jgi:hypothetical protein
MEESDSSGGAKKKITSIEMTMQITPPPTTSHLKRMIQGSQFLSVLKLGLVVVDTRASFTNHPRGQQCWSSRRWNVKKGFVGDYCTSRGWHWEPQAAQMLHMNLLDLSVFPNMMSRCHVQLARKRGGLKVLSENCRTTSLGGPGIGKDCLRFIQVKPNN